MKKVTTLLLVMLSVFCFGQESSFKISKEGFTDYIITDVSGTPSDLYNKTLKWINESYKNPEEVIVMKVENEKVRIKGFKDQLYCSSSLNTNICSQAIYFIEISFKDGRYKFDPQVLEIIIDGNKFESDLVNTSNYYDKKGNIKKSFTQSVTAIESLFNDLNTDLYNSIVGQKSNDKW